MDPKEKELREKLRDQMLMLIGQLNDPKVSTRTIVEGIMELNRTTLVHYIPPPGEVLEIFKKGMEEALAKMKVVLKK